MAWKYREFTLLNWDLFCWPAWAGQAGAGKHPATLNNQGEEGSTMWIWISDGTLAEKAAQPCQCFLWQVGMWLWLFRDLQGRRQQPKTWKEIRMLEWKKRHPWGWHKWFNLCTCYQPVTITKLALNVKVRGGLGITPANGSGLPSGHGKHGGGVKGNVMGMKVGIWKKVGELLAQKIAEIISVLNVVNRS